MRLAALLFDLARLAVLVLVFSLFVPLAHTGRAAFYSFWPILVCAILALVAAGVLVAEHAARRPDLWIYRSKTPARLLLALESALTGYLVFGMLL